jgi:hypothetical protein
VAFSLFFLHFVLIMKPEGTNSDAFFKNPIYLFVLIDLHVIVKDRTKICEVEWQWHHAFDKVHKLDFESFIGVTKKIHQQKCFVHFSWFPFL